MSRSDTKILQFEICILQFMFTNTLNPILLSLGPITIRWYGLFLAIGVLLSVLIIVRLFKQNNLRPQNAVDLCVWLIVGGLIGARLGEVLFYEPVYFFSHPLEILFINHGGLSSHGMTIGLLVTFWIWIRRHYLTPNPSPYKGEGSWKRIADILVIPIPLLAAFIRIGNFFNSEILGKATNLSWGVKFPLTDPPLITRHPIQIYEALVAISVYCLLFTIYKKKKLSPLFTFHFFLFAYFSSRFVLEFWKADYQTSCGISVGQLLSLPFIIYSTIWFIKNAKCRMRNAK